MEQYLDFERMSNYEKAMYIHSIDQLGKAVRKYDHIRDLQRIIEEKTDELLQAKQDHMEIVTQCEDAEFRIQVCPGNNIDLDETLFNREQYGQARINSMHRIDGIKDYIKEKKVSVKEAYETMDRWMMASFNFYEMDGLEGYVKLETVGDHYKILNEGLFEWDFFCDKYQKLEESVDDAHQTISAM